jgi:hypothetical protein
MFAAVSPAEGTVGFPPATLAMKIAVAALAKIVR